MADKPTEDITMDQKEEKQGSSKSTQDLDLVAVVESKDVQSEKAEAEFFEKLESTTGKTVPSKATRFEPYEGKGRVSQSRRNPQDVETIGDTREGENKLVESQLSIVETTSGGESKAVSDILKVVQGNPDEYSPGTMAFEEGEAPRIIEMGGVDYVVPDVDDQEVITLIKETKEDLTDKNKEELLHRVDVWRGAFLMANYMYSHCAETQEEEVDTLKREGAELNKQLDLARERESAAHEQYSIMRAETEEESRKLYAQVREQNQEILELQASKTSELGTEREDVVMEEAPTALAGWKRKAETLENQLEEAKAKVAHWQRETEKAGERNLALTTEYAGKFQGIIETVEKSVKETAETLTSMTTSKGADPNSIFLKVFIDNCRDERNKKLSQVDEDWFRSVISSSFGQLTNVGVATVTGLDKGILAMVFTPAGSCNREQLQQVLQDRLPGHFAQRFQRRMKIKVEEKYQTFAILGLSQHYFSLEANDFRGRLQEALQAAKLLREDEHVQTTWFAGNKKTAHFKIRKDLAPKLSDKTLAFFGLRITLKMKSQVVVCYKCGGRWHFQEACTREKEGRCFNCAKPNCPKRGKSYQCHATPKCLVCNETGHNVFDYEHCRLANLGRGTGQRDEQ